MNGKVPPDEPLTRTEAEGATVDLPEGLGFFTTGQVLGERYEILEMLGRGGMGEVWRAFDLKLRVEVGLKALREELFQSKRRLELLRQEVRAAREVVSPNVCRIFDLIEIDGRELVSMEYVDGATLLGVLQERGPLELKEAQDIASQFLAGLEAIHKAGLVHRDVKPENIMLTRAERVVVMDFGLARGPESGAGSVSGTPAYMAPEHAAGGEVDARADVYSAGVVLAEMVSPEGIKSYESRQSVWEGVRSEPAQVPDSPWAPVIKRAVARDRERRQNSAHTLIRELEDVTLRVEGAEDLHPYPGLASFAEEDAEYFFGREAEVEQMWRKLEGPPRLLGVIGPSGAGKTSFIRAGLTAHTPSDWQIIRSTPGIAAIASLASVVARETAGDPDTVALLPQFGTEDIAVEILSRWSGQSPHSLIVIDQFEELFTQNTNDEQRRFAHLLERLVLEADIHVLLVMRDDFVTSCNAWEPLRPVFHELTVLDPPTGGNLRRALVQPATKCGYRFEDDELVDELLAEVEGERGALPMLAFALARLWEKRDRERGLLTRQAYHDIGGVGGALARHAEATVDRIGVKRIPIVRELFRNLVTAEGTRAVREWDELLSIFEGKSNSLSSRAKRLRAAESRDPPKLGATPKARARFQPVGDPSTRSSNSLAQGDTIGSAAEEVLRELIDARLLTSYEVRIDEHEPIRRVEIIHESLLANWPRLVRWQTQDADAVQVREQLRQAAKTWDEHDRSRDYLWTGRAFREYSVWRESYPGGLSELEDAFAQASTTQAQRRKRRRRATVISAFTALLVVLAVVGNLWQRSVTEARRAEGAKLLSLGQLELDKHPSATIAYTIASLELDDRPEGRRLALEALWRGPTELRLQTGSPFSVDFSPDGRWMLTSTVRGGGKLWPSDGGSPVALDFRKNTGEGRISPRGDLVALLDKDMLRLALWSFPEGRFLRTLEVGEDFNQLFWFSRDGGRVITTTEIVEDSRYEAVTRSWNVEGGEPKVLARFDQPFESMGTFAGVDPTEARLAWIDGTRFHMSPLEGGDSAALPAVTLEHDQNLSMAVFSDDGRRLATAEISGKINAWSLDDHPPLLERTFEWGAGQAPWSVRFDASGRLLGSADGYLGDLSAPPTSGWQALRRAHGAIEDERTEFGVGVAFHPDSTWMATGHQDSVSLWPLTRRYPTVIRGHEAGVHTVAFSPDGEWLVSASGDGSIREWALGQGSAPPFKTLFAAQGAWDASISMDLARDGTIVAFGTYNGWARVVPLNGGPRLELKGVADLVRCVAVNPASRLVAVGVSGTGEQQSEPSRLRVWDLETGDVRWLDSGDDWGISSCEFTSQGDLLVDTGPFVRRWSFEGTVPRLVDEVNLAGSDRVGFALQDHRADGNEILVVRQGRLLIHDFVTETTRDLESHGNLVFSAAFDPTGEIVVSTDRKGVVRVGLATGEEPHLLLGHEPLVNGIDVSADGRWIATSGGDKTIRIWPMPDLDNPPLHTLPRQELIAKLKTLTNLRVVRDEESTRRWKLTVGPFPGWETVPTW